MKATMVALALALAASTSTVWAQPVRWTRYTIPQTGTSVDFPSSIFTEEAGRAGRVRPTLPNRRRTRRPHDPGRAERREQFTRRFSREEAPAFPHPVQARDAALLRGLQLQGRQGFLRPLQLLRAAGPLRADQLSRRRRARLGRRRHPDQPVSQGQVDRHRVPRMTSSAGARSEHAEIVRHVAEFSCLLPCRFRDAKRTSSRSPAWLACPVLDRA